MRYRSGLLLLVVAFSSSACFSEELDWQSRFTEARRLALKRAGPASSAAGGYPHVTAGKSHVSNAVSVPVQTAVIPKIRRGMRRPGPKRAKPRHVSRPRSRELVDKARRAREIGQLEQALRLYKLARDVEPNSVEAKEGIEALQREMN